MSLSRRVDAGADGDVVSHVPHLHCPRPWSDGAILLGDVQRHHLVRVLRRLDDSPVTYTDGEGTRGSGVFVGSSVVRGEEALDPPPSPRVVVAVAAPQNQDRCRFIVEKLAELGIDDLQWITTDHSQGRAPRSDKCAAWATAALQQSRGSWLMRVHDPVALQDLDENVRWFAAERSGGRIEVDRSLPIGLVVGPEGGLSAGELARFSRKVRLGPSVLRTETAAIVGAAHCLELAGRR
jgi:16S rRNA (uracil1498-N3)-methyltransferase